MACLVLAAAGSVVARPAAAASNGGLVVDATVMFAPGLSDTPASQTVSFSGSGVVTVVRHGRLSPVAVDCSFSGGSTGTENVLRGAGAVDGSCGTIGGESMSLWCGFTYQRSEGVMALAGGCTVAMADATQSTQALGTMAVQLGTVRPVTTAPARVVADLATVEAPQAAVGNGSIYHSPGSSSTTIQMYSTLAGVFASGPKAEAAVIWCALNGYGPITLVHEVAEGTANVSCGGSSPTGQWITKECSMPFALIGTALTMSGQCTLSVGGVSTQVFETHTYALALALNWGSLSPRYTFTATGSHQAVAP